MHKLLTLALVAKACSLAVVTGGRNEVVGHGIVVASPEAATRFEYFGFAGSGWQRHETLRVHFISPSGEKLVFRGGNCGSDIVVTGDNGEFSFAIRPVEDLVGGALGAWTAEFDTCRGTVSSAAFRVVAG